MCVAGEGGSGAHDLHVVLGEVGVLAEADLRQPALQHAPRRRLGRLHGHALSGPGWVRLAHVSEDEVKGACAI